jgi:hypothetical protein
VRVGHWSVLTFFQLSGVDNVYYRRACEPDGA